MIALVTPGDFLFIDKVVTGLGDDVLDLDLSCLNSFECSDEPFDYGMLVKRRNVIFREMCKVKELV